MAPSRGNDIARPARPGILLLICDAIALPLQFVSPALYDELPALKVIATMEVFFWTGMSALRPSRTCSGLLWEWEDG